MLSHNVANLSNSLRRLVGTLVSIVETRLDLLATDFAEARGNIAGMLLVAGWLALSLAMATILVVLFILALFWDTHRLISIGALIGLFALSGSVAWQALNRRARAALDLFSGTRAELRRDRAQLGGGDTARAYSPPIRPRLG